jgi:MFS family permease
MALQGAVNPLFRVGSDAMLADLIPPQERPDAYALMRLSNNIGVAIGPAVGGFLAAASYNLAFFFAAGGLMIYGLLLALRARETLPEVHSADEGVGERFGGYGKVLGDKPYRSFVLAFLFTQLSASLLWVMLSVYAKTNYGLSESRYGLIPTTNALMVVALQIPITRWTKRYKPQSMMALGALFYALGVGSVAFGSGFWDFWVSMVIMTIGELVLVPTSSTYAANSAPVDMRGRYMSIYGLTWNLAQGIGPVGGGFLNDTFGPRTMWYGGGITGLISTVLFLMHGRAGQAKEMETLAPIERQ